VGDADRDAIGRPQVAGLGPAHQAHPQIGDGAAGAVGADVAQVGDAVGGEVLDGDVHGASLPVVVVRRVARLAVGLTGIAIGVPLLAPRREAAAAPLGGGHAEALLERAGKRARRLEPAVERDLGHVGPGACEEGAGGPLEADPLHELLQVLAGDALEDAVEVERREGGDLGEDLEG
jgi:hypothetical protein